MRETWIAEAYANAKDFQDRMRRLGYRTCIHVYLDDWACLVIPQERNEQAASAGGSWTNDASRG